MFRNTRDPSSGSFIQCLAKITVKVPLWTVQYTHALSRLCSTHMHSLDCAVHTRTL